MMRINQTKELEAEYQHFMDDLQIEPHTGILGIISNPRQKDKMGTIRFSGYPYIGTEYWDSEPRVLVVGLDIGADELDYKNTYHSLDSRREGIETIIYNKDINPHMSGTYGICLYLLKDFYGYQEYWDKFFNGRNETFKSIVTRFGPTTLPNSVLRHIALTNIHKFVTVNRNGRAGGENRVWYNREQEISFFKKEVSLFDPDIVYVQGQSKIDWRIRHFLEEKGLRIVYAAHPSSWISGANTPCSVEKFNLANW